MVEQPGDLSLPGFSHWERPQPRHQLPCYLTYTTPHTHEVVAAHLHLSPIRTGSVSGKGPRYCPSIDRKMINFPEKGAAPRLRRAGRGVNGRCIFKGSHQPAGVGAGTDRSGNAGSRACHTDPTRYAVEYDLPPHQLSHSLAVKGIAGLFAAGQINGTSGYEEAAAQGLMVASTRRFWYKNVARRAGSGPSLHWSVD